MSDWLPERLPEDVDAERSLLATLCAPGAEGAAKIESRLLSPEHFVHPAHRAIFEALTALIEQRADEYGPLALKIELDRQGNLGRVGGYPGLIELLGGEEVGRPHVLTIRLTEKLKRRQLIRLGSSLMRLAIEEDEDVATLASTVLAQLGSIQREGKAEEISSWVEILDMAANGEAFRDGDGERGGWWGIESLDDLAPIPCGQVTFIGARPGIGKTALGTQIAVESAMRGRKPLFVQLELPKKTTQARVASYITRVSTRILKEGRYSPEIVAQLRAEAATLCNGGIIAPRAGTPWASIEATISESIDRNGTNLVVLDYFSLIGRTVAKGSSEAYAFAHVSEQITSFAKDHQGVGFVLLGQLKTDAADREPRDGDAADSDRPARDAAVSLMLWRNPKEAVWAVLRKNRDGALGWKHEMVFQGWAQRFSMLEGETSGAANAGGAYRN